MIDIPNLELQLSVGTGLKVTTTKLEDNPSILIFVNGGDMVAILVEHSKHLNVYLRRSITPALAVLLVSALSMTHPVSLRDHFEVDFDSQLLFDEHAERFFADYARHFILGEPIVKKTVNPSGPYKKHRLN